MPHVSCVVDSLCCSCQSQKTITVSPVGWTGEGNAFLTLYLQGNQFSWLVLSWGLLGPRGLGVGAEVRNAPQTCCLTWGSWVALFFFLGKQRSKGNLTFLLWNMQVWEKLPQACQSYLSRLLRCCSKRLLLLTVQICRQELVNPCTVFLWGFQILFCHCQNNYPINSGIFLQCTCQMFYWVLQSMLDPAW